jgi:hypothetical protein
MGKKRAAEPFFKFTKKDKAVKCTVPGYAWFAPALEINHT